MKRHSKANGIHKELTIDSKVARKPMPSEVEAETLRQIAGGPDTGHERDPLEPNALRMNSWVF